MLLDLGSLWPFRAKANGHAAMHASEVPRVGEPPLKPENDLARVLSPTQVSTFLECSAKWWYKHGLHLPEQKSSNLGIGIAFHDAVMENFRQKIDTKEDLPVAGTRALFRSSWESMKDDLVFAPKEHPNNLRDTGEALVEEYMTMVAPRIQPAAVEQVVCGSVGGVKVRGRIDVIDATGRIIDAKTSRKKPAGIPPNYRFQVATYAKLHGQASGTVRLDTVTKTKTIQVVEQSFPIVESDLLQLERMYPLAQEAMRSGLYVPNRNSNLCSRKYCTFWEHCESDYGGVVAEQ
jgi:hypothetical protein